MATELKGTAALKALIQFAILLVQKSTTLDTDGDGRVSLMEAINAITPVGFKIPAIVNSLPEVRAEWKDLSKEELDELVVWFAQEFDLPRLEHAKIEAIVRKSAQIVVTNFNYYQDMKAILG